MIKVLEKPRKCKYGLACKVISFINYDRLSVPIDECIVMDLKSNLIKIK